MKQEIYSCVTSLPPETGGSVSNLALQYMLLLATLCVCVCVCVCLLLRCMIEASCNVQWKEDDTVEWGGCSPC